MKMPSGDDWHELKDAAAAWLSSAAIPGEIDETDARLRTYIECVRGDAAAHNLYEILSVKRFLQLKGRHAWNASRVRRFIRFYEAIRFSGVSGRRRYKLTPVQVFQFANIFGFADEIGRRLCRTAYIFVPRKFSKTTMAAALAVYDMLFGDNNAQAYIGANSYEQAKICFDEIRAIMRDLDPIARHFQVNREKITYKDRGRDSLIRCLTANAKTQDGLFASLVIMDEFAQARNTATKNGADLKNVLTSSMGPRREPLTVIISTASEVIDGAFYNELEGVKKVLRGDADNDTIFASLFMPDKGDDESSPATWAKVQPHIGITVQPDFYAHEWANAQLSAENMLAFRTKLLNVFCLNEERRWLPVSVCRELCGGFDISAARGVPCAIAFDLSVHDDFSAVSYLYYSSNARRFYCHTDYYFPSGAMQQHPNRRLYETWVSAGYLKLCQGAVIDYKQIAGDIIERSRTLKILRIVYDSFKSTELVNILASVGGGGVLQPYSQTHGNFNRPVEHFEFLAFSEPRGIILNDNPINVFCLSNCVILSDNMENRKPHRPSEGQKIDGAITMLMALGALDGYER